MTSVGLASAAVLFRTAAFVWYVPISGGRASEFAARFRRVAETALLRTGPDESVCTFVRWSVADIGGEACLPQAARRYRCCIHVQAGTCGRMRRIRRQEFWICDLQFGRPETDGHSLLALESGMRRGRCREQRFGGLRYRRLLRLQGMFGG